MGNFDPPPERRVSINYFKFFSIGYLFLLPHLFNHPVFHLYLYGLIVFYFILWFIIQFQFLKVILAFAIGNSSFGSHFPLKYYHHRGILFLALSYLLLLQDAPNSLCIILFIYFNQQLLLGAFVSFIEEWYLNPSSGCKVWLLLL